MLGKDGLLHDPFHFGSGNLCKIFVNNRGSKELTVIDANTMAVAATILPLPATSFQLALAPDGKTLAVV